MEEGGQLWQPACELPEKGCYYPPTLITDVQPAATLAQEEIFGPVLVSMTFRTPAEAVALANNSRYGLAASVWTENINLALDIAPKLKAGSVWVNCSNVFDAAAGFRRLPGIRIWPRRRQRRPVRIRQAILGIPSEQRTGASNCRGLRRWTSFPETKHRKLTAPPKLYIGGKQVRPDGGYSNAAYDATGKVIAEIPAGNRKDIRNAVEAARAASGWSTATAHNRAQVLLLHC